MYETESNLSQPEYPFTKSGITTETSSSSLYRNTGIDTWVPISPRVSANLTVSAFPGSWAKDTPEEKQNKKIKKRINPIMIFDLIKTPFL
jgi:hypothetical protein